jgi:hypothetical protein
MTRTASPDYFVLEGDLGSNVPAVPTLDQMSGADFTDDLENPPIPDQQPTAADWNQVAFTAWAAAKMAPRLSIGCTGGSSPALNSVVAMNRNISTNTPTNPDIALSHIATGHYTVAIPTAKLPAMTMPPRAWANKAGACAASASWVSAGLIAVYTSDSTGLIDAAWTLEVSGY